MRSFLPFLSILSPFLPSSHAFHAPGARPSPLPPGSPTASKVAPFDQSIGHGQNLVQRSSFAAAAALVLATTNAAWAVSGGGLDYAGIDISGRDFSNGNYKGKDFTQVRPVSAFAVFRVRSRVTPIATSFPPSGHCQSHRFFQLQSTRMSVL